MEPIVFSPDKERAAYGRVLNTMKKFNSGVDFIINQTTLFVQKAITANDNKLEFNLYENTSSDISIEKKLNRNDLFFVYAIALGIKKQDESTSPKRYGNYPIFTFPDPNYFVGANAGANLEEWQALENLYNGTLDVMTSPVSRITGFKNHLFRYVPEQQTLRADGATLNPQLNDEYPAYGPSLEERGFVVMHPMLILDGAENNKVEVTLAEGDRTLIAGAVNQSNSSVNTRNVAVLQLYGWLVNNGAQKVGKWTAA